LYHWDILENYYFGVSMDQIPYIGELASIGTSIAFSFAPIYFTLAVNRVGSVVVNRMRLIVATVIILIIHTIGFGYALPFDVGADKWFWFGLSGVIGLALGDAALFQALDMIGPRVTMLIFATSPLISAIFGALFFGEYLKPIHYVGILITILSATYVSLTQDSSESRNPTSGPIYKKGLFYAFLGSLGQSFGLITAKVGLQDGFPSITGLLMRMFMGMLALWLWTLFAREAKSTFTTFFSDSKAIKLILIASFIGPTIGVWLSMISVQNTELGIASTLQSLNPIILLPLSYFYFKEKVNYQSVIGTVLALGGIALLFLG
jgi:drug/metabolite transporter (DMT)-like permease